MKIKSEAEYRCRVLIKMIKTNSQFHKIKTNSLKKLSISSSLVLLVFLMSCSTSMKYTWTKENYQGRTYKKVLVIAEGATYKARTNM